MAPLTPQQKAERTYDAAADFFDDPALGFWDRSGRRTVELLDLRPSSRVLDVCCGTGASALPAAAAVDASGTVIGVDLSENLLALARKKAAALGLQNISFLKADMKDLAFEPDSFDAVVIVFGIFFIPDMEAQLQKLWRLVRPGGKLAVTTWGQRFFEPAYTEWNREVALLAPECVNDFNPWDRITTVAAVRQLMVDGVTGAAEIRVVAEEHLHPLTAPADFWHIALGSGLRWQVEQMGEAKAELLKKGLLRRLTERPSGPVTSIETNVIYGLAEKPYI
jgi:ubiquinone/menaquinone biosynthesis C-methylase UbiE